MSTPKYTHAKLRAQPVLRKYTSYEDVDLSDTAHYLPLPRPPVPHFRELNDGYATPAITSQPIGYPPPSSGHPINVSFGPTGARDHVGEHLRQYNGREPCCQECGKTGNLLKKDVPFAPPVDILSNDRAIRVDVWIPGVKQEDVQMKWIGESNALCIKGLAQRSGNENLDYKVVCAESTTGRFKQCISLLPETDVDESIDSVNITTKLEDGVLMVTLPKIGKDWTNLKGIDIN